MGLSNKRKKELLSSGKTYASVQEMVLDMGDKKLAKKLKQWELDAAISFSLSLVRINSNMTANQLAKKIGKTEKWVYDIEDSDDKKLTIGQINKYLSGFNKYLGFSIEDKDENLS